MPALATSKFPFRDINLRVTNDAYTFTSPSSPDAPALVIDRPTGDIRLSDSNPQTTKRATRVSSIAGILGIVQLRLGMLFYHSPPPPFSAWLQVKASLR